MTHKTQTTDTYPHALLLGYATVAARTAMLTHCPTAPKSSKGRRPSLSMRGIGMKLAIQNSKPTKPDISKLRCLENFSVFWKIMGLWYSNKMW